MLSRESVFSVFPHLFDIDHDICVLVAVESHRQPAAVLSVKDRFFLVLEGKLWNGIGPALGRRQHREEVKLSAGFNRRDP